ncbi:MAG: PEGA domain-containing protein [Deltaproteobacteria bacterium]|nr:PEGA domain-containing protein [Deltaproteobacteria bacterium]
MWLIPVIAVAAAATVALCLLAWSSITAGDTPLTALVAPVRPAPPAPPPPVADEPPLPAGPVKLRPVPVPDPYEPYQSVLDGELAGLDLDAAASNKVMRIIADYRRVALEHQTAQSEAMARVRDQLARPDPDTNIVLAAHARALAAETAYRRATLAGRIDVRGALTTPQRRLVEARAAKPAPSPSTPAPRLATLRVQTTPPGAYITVDGRPVGRSPVAVQLPLGAIDIRASLRGYGMSGLPYQLKEDSTVKINLVPDPPPVVKTGKGRLSITSDVPADISVDGALMGKTPITIDVATGRHSVSASGGGDVENRTVSVEDGGVVHLKFFAGP